MSYFDNGIGDVPLQRSTSQFTSIITFSAITGLQMVNMKMSWKIAFVVMMFAKMKTACNQY